MILHLLICLWYWESNPGPHACSPSVPSLIYFTNPLEDEANCVPGVRSPELWRKHVMWLLETYNILQSGSGGKNIPEQQRSGLRGAEMGTVVKTGIMAVL